MFYLPLVVVVIVLKLWFEWGMKNWQPRTAKNFIKHWFVAGMLVLWLSVSMNLLESYASGYIGYVKGECLEVDYDEGGQICLRYEPLYVGVAEELEFHLVKGLKYALVIGLFGAFIISSNSDE